MKLDVISSPKQDWFHDGLQFTCAQCGNCCTGGPGYVWVSDVEIERLAAFLQSTPREVTQKYCRKIGGQWSLKETRRGDLYDCVFLKEQKPTATSDEHIVQSKRICSIYPVRPLQCRTWPFWDGNMRTKAAWDRAAKHCHGMNRGRKFELDEMLALHNAEDWPEKPPTSDYANDQGPMTNKIPTTKSQNH